MAPIRALLISGAAAVAVLAGVVSLSHAGVGTDAPSQSTCSVSPRFVWGLPHEVSDGNWCEVVGKYPKHHRPTYIVEGYDGHVYVYYGDTIRFPDNAEMNHRLVDAELYDNMKRQFDDTIRVLVTPYCAPAEPVTVQPGGVAGVQYPLRVRCTDGRTVQIDAPTLPHHNLSNP